MKIDHDRASDRKVALPIIDELKNMENMGFALSMLNQDVDENW